MNKPFASAQEEAILSVIYTAQLFETLFADVMKTFDVSMAQYNLLRILRGSEAGLACSEIAQRMITRDPDITRLLDRLENQDLIVRERDTRDRRVVKVKITPPGLKVLDAAEPALEGRRQHATSGLSKDELKQLIETLQVVRENIRQSTQRKEVADEK